MLFNIKHADHDSRYSPNVVELILKLKHKNKISLNHALISNIPRSVPFEFNADSDTKKSWVPGIAEYERSRSARHSSVDKSTTKECLLFTFACGGLCGLSSSCSATKTVEKNLTFSHLKKGCWPQLFNPRSTAQLHPGLEYQEGTSL